MNASELLAAERQALCDTLDSVGPDAPTLCEGWTASDLAAHLVVRERDPSAGPGILLPGPFARYTHKRMERVEQRGFGWMVDRLRNGPPVWFSAGPMAIPNLVENFVHHEDVRRARGDAPRQLDTEVESALWKVLSRMSRLMMRRARGTGIELVASETRRKRVKRGEKFVTITGPVGELVLYAYGRKSAAKVVLDGPPEAVAIVEAATFGI